MIDYFWDLRDLKHNYKKLKAKGLIPTFSFFKRVQTICHIKEVGQIPVATALVVLRITAPPHGDGAPHRGQQRIFNWFLRVFLQVCLDGSRLRQFPLQLYTIKKKQIT